MPIVQTWVSDPDYPKYLAIKAQGKRAWTEHVHNALNGQVFADKEYVVTETKPIYPEADLYLDGVHKGRVTLPIKPIKTPKTVTKDTGYGKVKVGVHGTWSEGTIKTPNDIADAFKLADKDGFTNPTYKHRKVIKSPKHAVNPISKSFSARKKK